ncbi:MAG TPA: hypothetical protein VGK94_02815 [Candidatus Polarisedimenticolia bacterium]
MVLAVLAALSAACAEMRPNLVELYPHAATLPHRPVIIVPGAFGSRLRDERTGEVVWGRLANLLTSRFKLALNPLRAERTDLLDLPIDSTDMTANRDHLLAYDMFDGVAGRAFYKRIVATLTGVAGYRFGDINDPRPGQDCFAFHYDWRRDVVENGRLLGEAIARVRAAAGGPHGELPKVDLIAHSLGGLVARYYVKYGTRDVLGDRRAVLDYSGARDVDTVVLIGVPNEGSLDSLLSLNEGIRIARPLPPEAIFTMPAAYQTLPRLRIGPFIDPSGQPLDIDLYEPSNWERYGWSAFAPASLRRLREESVREFGREEGQRRYDGRIEKMRAFLAAALERAGGLNLALDRRGRVEDPVHYFAFGGDCTSTPARAMIVTGENGAVRTITRFKDLPGRLATAEIQRLMVEPGDGSVTRSSLLARHSGDAANDPMSGLHLDYSLFLCDTHRHLTENITFQDNLLQFLLYRR